MSSHEDDVTDNPPGYFTAQGYAWYAYPVAEDAPDRPFDFYKPDPAHLGHVPYCGSITTATGLLNKQRDGGHFFLTDEESGVKVFDGWEFEPAELDDDFEIKGCGTIRLLREIRPRHPEYELFGQYEIEGWD